MSKQKIALLVGITFILGAFFRLYMVNSMPGGLFPDEAANGLDINLIDQGQLQPFYERGNGREALFFYWEWVWVQVFGRTPLAHHFSSALIGIFTLFATYLVSKKMWQYQFEEKEAKILALITTFLLATSAWHVVLSRTGFRAIQIPLFSSLSLWALLAIPKADTLKKRMLWALAAGAFFALGFYTYIAFRIMAPLVVGLIIWAYFGSSEKLLGLIKKYTLPAIGIAIAFAIVIAPLAHYFYTHPGSFVGRSGQVSVFNEELNNNDLFGTILEVTRLSLNAYFTEGDLNWRHNVSGKPFLSPLISPFFALGFAVVILQSILYLFSPRKNKQYFPSFLLIAWFTSFLLPVITTAEGIPHGLRAIGTIPSVFCMTAYGAFLGGRYIWNMSKKYPQGPQLMETSLRTSLVVLLLVFIVAVPVQTYAWYFGEAKNSPENFYAFRSDLFTVSKYLNEFGNRNDTYLVLDKFSVQSVDYMTTKVGASACDRNIVYRSKNCIDDPKNMPYIQVDPERSWMSEVATYENQSIWPNGLGTGKKIVFAQSTIFDIKKFKEHHPNSKLIKEERNQFGQAVLAVYEIK